MTSPRLETEGGGVWDRKQTEGPVWWQRERCPGRATCEGQESRGVRTERVEESLVQSGVNK